MVFAKPEQTRARFVRRLEIASKWEFRFERKNGPDFLRRATSRAKFYRGFSYRPPSNRLVTLEPPLLYERARSGEMQLCERNRNFLGRQIKHA